MILVVGKFVSTERKQIFFPSMKGWEEIERKTYEFNPEFGQLKEICVLLGRCGTILGKWALP